MQVRIGDAMQAHSGGPVVHSATLPVTPGSGGLPCTYLGLNTQDCNSHKLAAQISSHITALAGSLSWLLELLR